MLSGRAVGLRAIEVDDLETLRAWRNRPELRRNFREAFEIGSAGQRRWFESAVTNDPRTVMLAIVRLADGELAGATGLCAVDWVSRHADLSIYVGIDGGYIDDELAVDAATVLLDYGFDQLGLHRVWVETYAFDHAKEKLLDTLQFQLEGRHRDHHFADGAWHDSRFWGMLADEWRTRRGGGGAARG